MRRRLRWAAQLLIVFGAVALFVLALEARREFARRTGLYWYEVERGYDLKFAGAEQSRLIEVSPLGLRWPDRADACDTALLELSVASTWAGRWFEPGIRVEVPGFPPFEQHFERGAYSTRYLNLSPLCGQIAGGDSVALSGRHLEWPSQQSNLVLFRNPERAEEPVLVLAPHPDDAEIAAFGLYRSRHAVVVTLTAGDDARPGFGHLVSDVDDQVELRGRLRSWDSVAVPLWGGVQSGDAINLGYLSGLLAEMHARPDAVIGAGRGGSAAVQSFRRVDGSAQLEQRDATSSWDSLVQDLVVLIREVAPALIVAPHPVLDAALDHRFTAVALFEALSRVETNQSTLLLYTNHAVGSEYYPFGPADALVTLPPWFGDPLPLAGLYSHPLTAEAQLDKLFALEAMHDLRAPPWPEFGDPTLRMLRRVKRTLQELWRDPHVYYSYYRRAARPNELFFVYRPGDRDTLMAQTESWVAERADQDEPKPPAH